jgi:hypothetical protein
MEIHQIDPKPDFLSVSGTVAAAAAAFQRSNQENEMTRK